MGAWRMRDADAGWRRGSLHLLQLPWCRPPLLQDGEDVQRVCRGLQQAVPPGLLQDRRLLFKVHVWTEGWGSGRVRASVQCSWRS